MVQHDDVRLRFESFIDECQLNDVTFIAFASFRGVGRVGVVVMKEESSDDIVRESMIETTKVFRISHDFGAGSATKLLQL